MQKRILIDQEQLVHMMKVHLRIAHQWEEEVVEIRHHEITIAI